MPSWPTRLFLGSSTTNNPPSHGQQVNESVCRDRRLRGAAQPATPRRSPPLPASNNPHGSWVPRRASQHGRSISHPFPSIFGSGKKRNTEEEEGENVVDAKTLLAGPPGSYTADLMGSTRPGPAHTEEFELISGKCATCDSQVRWPRHLDVFRCTVCLMINDQKPNFPKPAADDVPVEEPSDSSGLKANARSPVKGTSIFGGHRLEANCRDFQYRMCLCKERKR